MAKPARKLALFITVPATRLLISPKIVLENDPRCACDAEYAPVCGSDGNTYTNACLLRCTEAYFAARPKHSVEIIGIGPCVRSYCHCPPVINYVCGSDQYTYINSCFIHCHNKRMEKLQLSINVEIDSQEQCKGINFCVNNIVPVCGTDSKTYRNLCFLQYASDQNLRNDLPHIYLKHWGPCRVEICPCPLHLNPVCGSNGREYSNLCIFNCEKRRRIQLNMTPLLLTNNGPCLVECVCPKDLSADPICGSDSKTYASQCHIYCSNKKRVIQSLPPVKVIKDGPCDCSCTKEYDPVCASDYKSYRNLCELECENKIRKLQNMTALRHLNNGECNPCTCSQYYVDPVCSSDGKNYNNPCFLICENRRRELQGLATLSYRNGPCTHSWNYVYDPVCGNTDDLSNPCHLYSEPATLTTTDNYFTILS